MKIRINDKDGNNIAECELFHHDIGIWFTQNKKNVKKIWGDIEDGRFGFIDVLDIDIEDLNPS